MVQTTKNSVMMQLIQWGTALVSGTIFGSFANVLVFRLRERSTVLGRSKCVHCGENIKPQHLVPIFSYFILRGRCASCRKKIHFQYPLVEFAAGVLAVGASLRHPFLIDPHQISGFLFEAFFLIDLLILVTFDLRWQLLPIEFMAGSTLVFGAWAWISGIISLPSLLIGLAVGVGFLGVQVIVSRGAWMGSGDPWMGALLGATLGWPKVGLGLYVTYIAGGLFAAGLLISGTYKRGARIPFAPLLAFGGLVALWFGDQIVPWMAHYLSFI